MALSLPILIPQMEGISIVNACDNRKIKANMRHEDRTAPLTSTEFWIVLENPGWTRSKKTYHFHHFATGIFD
jgi:hypothetical protein